MPYKKAVELDFSVLRQMVLISSLMYFGIERNRGSYSNAFCYMFVFGSANKWGNVKQQYIPVSFASNYRKNLTPAKESANLATAKKRLATINNQIKERNAKLDTNLKNKLNAHVNDFNKAKNAANTVMATKLRRV